MRDTRLGKGSFFADCSSKLTPPQFNYINDFNRVTREILKMPRWHNVGGMGCARWLRIYVQIANRIGGRPGSLLNIQRVFSGMDNIISDSECATCRIELDRWTNQAKPICLELRALSFYALWDSGKGE
jgi:hypothetical protein